MSCPHGNPVGACDACDMEDELQRLRAEVGALRAVVNNFEITGPDEDGLVWLVLRGYGITGKAMINLGTAARIVVQVALALEQDRRAAIAKAEAGNAQ
jgi:hypothetical protein